MSLSSTPISASGPRNFAIDLLRLVAAFAVVCIHIEPTTSIQGPLRSNILLACRFAVPVFFIISGYFLTPRLLDPSASLRSQLSRIARIFFGSCLLYLPFKIGREGVADTLRFLLDFRFLTHGTCYHLWFLSSLFFGIIMIHLLAKPSKIGGGQLAITSSVILALYLAANYSGFVTESQMEYLRYLSSIPLLHCGILCHQAATLPANSRTRITLALLVIGIIFMVGERHVMISAGTADNSTFQFSAGTLLFSLGLIGVALTFDLPPPLRVLAVIGSKYSLGIYVVHIWFVTLVKKSYAFVGVLDQIWSTLLMGPAVFLLSLLLLVCIRHLLEGIRRRGFGISRAASI